jgi:hypothetical protein
MMITLEELVESGRVTEAWLRAEWARMTAEWRDLGFGVASNASFENWLNASGWLDED